MDFDIRPAHRSEHPALGELTATAYLRDGLLHFGASDAYLEELRDVAKRAATAEVLVATAGHEVLGGVT
ncbi:GNAT family N-acetyltransferase, partial [Streptomyces sp. TRM76130]|nr:GNAT family N-acetyltransferase [Streptomyces sp. TRM76130]